jgi:hypothetical protein
MTPCGVAIVPARAAPSVWVSEKRKDMGLEALLLSLA